MADETDDSSRTRPSYSATPSLPRAGFRMDRRRGVCLHFFAISWAAICPGGDFQAVFSQLLDEQQPADFDMPTPVGISTKEARLRQFPDLIFSNLLPSCRLAKAFGENVKAALLAIGLLIAVGGALALLNPGKMTLSS